ARMQDESPAQALRHDPTHRRAIEDAVRPVVPRAEHSHEQEEELSRQGGPHRVELAQPRRGHHLTAEDRYDGQGACLRGRPASPLPEPTTVVRQTQERPTTGFRRAVHGKDLRVETRTRVAGGDPEAVRYRAGPDAARFALALPPDAARGE